MPRAKRKKMPKHTVEIQAVDCYREADPFKADLGGDPGLTRALTDSAGTGYATPKP